ncbi:MAG: amino acid ABC transporter permease, partial [Chloroflexota bacterium]
GRLLASRRPSQRRFRLSWTMAQHTDLTRPTAALEPDVAGELAAGLRRSRRRFRLEVLLVWALLIGALIGSLVAIDKIDPVFISTWAPFILGGAGLTIVICLGSILLATVLAVLGALGRLSTNPIIYAVASLYVSLVRGTPLIVQIIFIFFALPQLGIVLPALQAGIIALGFNYGAYMTEIFRAGIQAVPRGQREAAEALAMPERLVMRRIVLPQAIRIVVPAIGNEFIAMIKDSALVSIIGVTELLWRASSVGNSRFRTFEAILIAAAVYWVLTIIFSFFQERLERRMARGDR